MRVKNQEPRIKKKSAEYRDLCLPTCEILNSWFLTLDSWLSLNNYSSTYYKTYI